MALRGLSQTIARWQETGLDSDTPLLKFLNRKASSQEVMAISAVDAGKSSLDALGTSSRSGMPYPGASGPTQVATTNGIHLDSDKGFLPAVIISTSAPLVWLSRPIATTSPPNSSDTPEHPPVAVEIIDLVRTPDEQDVIDLVSTSDDKDMIDLVSTSDEKGVIDLFSSSDDSEVVFNDDPDCGDSDYDPAEKMSLRGQQKHYKDLERKMEVYGEMKLKRVMESPDNSIEEYQVSSSQRVRAFM